MYSGNRVYKKMKPRSQLAFAALLIVALALPASAGSIKTTMSETYTEALSGVKNTDVTVAFTFNSKTDMISGGKLSFKGGVFNGITDTFSGLAACSSGVCTYTLETTKANGDTISYTINLSGLNLTSANGSISNTKKNDGTFSYTATAVSEGGSQLSYLIPAGLVMFGGIFWSGSKRRGPLSRVNG